MFVVAVVVLRVLLLLISVLKPESEIVLIYKIKHITKADLPNAGGEAITGYTCTCIAMHGSVSCFHYTWSLAASARRARADRQRKACLIRAIGLSAKASDSRVVWQQGEQPRLRDA